MIDLELEDDLLALDTPPVQKIAPLLPSPADMLARCHEFQKEIAGGVVEVYYDGVSPDLQLATYVELFEDWWARYQRKANPMLLELAFMCAAKNRAGSSWGKVYCNPLERELRAEIIDCTATAVRLAVDLPFDTGRVKGNLKWLPRWRAMWFNRQSRKPLNPTEPFRLL